MHTVWHYSDIIILRIIIAGEQAGVLEPADGAGGGEEERRDCWEGGGGPGSGSTLPCLGQLLGQTGLWGSQTGGGKHCGSQGEPHEDVALPTAGQDLTPPQ